MRVSLVPLLLLCMIAAREGISCEASRKLSSKGVEMVVSSHISGVSLLFSRRLLAEGEEESNDMETELMLPDENDGQNLEVTTEEENEAVQSEQKEPVLQEEGQQAESLMEEEEVTKEQQKLEKKKKKEKPKKEPKLEPNGDGDSDSESVTKGGDEEKTITSETKKERRAEGHNQKVLEGEAKTSVELKSSDDKIVEKLQEVAKGVIKAKKEAKEDMEEEESNSKILEIYDIAADTLDKKKQQKLKNKVVKGEVMAEEAAEAFSVEGTPADVAEAEREGVTEALVSEVVEEENGGDMAEEKPQTKAKKGTDSSPRKRQGNSEDSNKPMKGKNAKDKPLKEKKGKEKSEVKAQVLEEAMEVKGFNPEDKPSVPATKAKQGVKKSSESVLGSELVEGDLDAKAEEKLEAKVGETLDLEKAETQDMVKPKAKGKKKKDKASKKAKKEEKLSAMDSQSLDEGKEEGTKSNAASLSKPTKAKEGKKVSVPESELESEMVEVVDVSAKTEEIVTKRNQTKALKPSKGTQEEPWKTKNPEEKPEVEVQATTKEEKVSTKEVSEEAQQSEMMEESVSEEAQQSEMMEESVSSSVSGNDEDDDEYGDFMQDFVDLSSKIQDTAQKVADHLGPNLQKMTDTSKVYFNKANQQITESFSPLVGKQFAPLLASLISYGLLLVPLAVVILLFEHIRALLSIQKVLLFVNIYLAAYFATLLLATFIIGEPMTFFYKSSASGYIHLQLLQALGYIIYLILQTFDLVASCSSETVPVKVTVVLQWFVAFMIGFHYYVTVFHRAMALKGPHTSWKIYGIYSVAFFILCLFARIKRTKKGYSQLGAVDTNKKS